MKKLEIWKLEVLQKNGSKVINNNGFHSIYTLDSYDSSLVEFPSEDEDNVELLRAKYEFSMVVTGKFSTKSNKLIGTCKDQEKILQICDEKQK